jgi:Ran GTPase-activating protein (RanGAP) involved in mRNA processing and transport
MLESLDLQSNHIAHSGFQALEEALLVNQTLKDLDLSQNYFTDYCILCLRARAVVMHTVFTDSDTGSVHQLKPRGIREKRD